MTDSGSGEQSGDVEAVLRALPASESEHTALLGRLYREHADFVWRVLLRFGIPESVAEDVAHEVFLVVGRRLPDYDASTPFKAWLYGIARGVAANIRRSRERSQRRLRVVEPPPDPQTPEQQVAQTQAAALVTRFLETLSPEQREAFVLVDIEGMSGPEAAAATSTKLNNVYSRLRLARARFREFAREAGAVPSTREESA